MSLPSTTGSPSMGGAAVADDGSAQPRNYCDGVGWVGKYFTAGLC